MYRKNEKNIIICNTVTEFDARLRAVSDSRQDRRMVKHNLKVYDRILHDGRGTQRFFVAEADCGDNCVKFVRDVREPETNALHAQLDALSHSIRRTYLSATAGMSR